MRFSVHTVSLFSQIVSYVIFSSFPSKQNEMLSICEMLFESCGADHTNDWEHVKGAGQTLTPLAAYVVLLTAVDVGGNALTCFKWVDSIYLQELSENYIRKLFFISKRETFFLYFSCLFFYRNQIFCQKFNSFRGHNHACFRFL